MLLELIILYAKRIVSLIKLSSLRLLLPYWYRGGVVVLFEPLEKKSIRNISI